MTTGGRLADLVWLIAVELRNRAVAMTARLRNPRYLIAFLVGVGYFVLIFSPYFTGEAGDEVSAPAWAVHVAPLGIAALVLFWWLRGGFEQALAFRPAEVAFLFPAPLARTTLIRYKLLHAQAGVLLSATFVTLLGPSHVAWPLAFFGSWVLVTTLHLHQLGSSLVRVTAAQRGGAGLRRVAAPLLVAAIVAGTLVWTMGRAIRGARAADDLPAAATAAMGALGSPASEAVLLPFSILLGPVFAVNLTQWGVALAGAVGLMLLHLMWVMRLDAGFEEVAAEAGRKRAEAVAAMRSGRAWWRLGQEPEAETARWIRVPLRPIGEPAAALAWSHLVGFLGDIRRATVAVIAASAAALFATMTWASGSVAGAALGMSSMAALLAGMVFVFGPVVLRYDLRRDLGRLEMLRAFPLDPRWLVISEMAAPVLLLTACELALLAGCAVLLPVGGASADVLRIALPLTLLVAVNAPGLLGLQVAVQNALALLFPGWIRIGGGTQGGIDAVGQGILSMLSAFLAFLLLLVLPVLGGLLLGGAYAPVLRDWAVIPGAMAFTGVVWLQLAWMTGWLARVYHRLDPVEAGLLR